MGSKTGFTRIWFKYITVGPPQIFALLLLLVFALQCAWLIQRRPFTAAEQDHIWSGRQQFEYGAVPRKFLHTPLVNLAASVPMKLDQYRMVTRDPDPEFVRRQVVRLRWMLRLPFVCAGLLLGVSLWYVSRRLYGNPGGYVALGLYCLSPAMVMHAATIDEAVPAAWGIFGVIFTAIAISHNLYAPVRKWCYRTLLLAVAIALAVASHPAAVVIAPLPFAFMLYLAPGRRWAAFAVSAIALLGAAFLVLASYSFRAQAFLSGIDLREWLAYQPKKAQTLLLGNPIIFLERFNPSMVLLLLAALFTYFFWRRTRYFGNTAPLLTAAGVLYLALITPVALTASIWALPFLFVFIGGIWADLLESRRGRWALGVLLILLAENAWFCLTLVRGAKVT